jgi:isopentenyldiphosphate isomerase
MSKKGNLNIVNENGEITGEDSRENIHNKGLLHREVHVWFYTTNGEIIFQHRSKSADTFPDLLDATVGGHVEIGQDYEDTALKEIEEETGIKTTKEKLEFIEFTRTKGFDPATNKTNNVLRAVYAYCFHDDLKNLKLETDKGVGFEAWTFDSIFNISEANRKKLIPEIVKEPTIGILRKIQVNLSGMKKD